MLVENVLVRPQSEGFVTISWTSESPDVLSWIFINGEFVVGPFMAETRDRAVTLPVPKDKTFVIEVHDACDLEEVPTAIAQKPLVKPQNLMELRRNGGGVSNLPHDFRHGKHRITFAPSSADGNGTHGD